MSRIDTTIVRFLRATVLGGATLGLVACGGGGGGGGSGGGGTGDTAVDESGRAVTTAGGEGVSEEAHNYWTAGVAAFSQAEEQGWNEARCENVNEQFEEAVDAQDGFAEALYMSGLTAERCDDESGARRFYNRALQANQELCKARVALGILDLAGGNRNAARSAFQRSVRDDPQCTSGYVNLAILQRRQGGAQLQEALSNLRRALAIESDYLPAFSQMALLYLQRADEARAGRQTAENRQAASASLDLAEIVCRQAQLIDRDYANIYNTWGLVKMRKGDIIEALRLFERAVSLDNNMFEGHMNFGQITLSFRGYADARRSFTRAVELRGGSYDAVIGLGAALRGLEEMDAAKAQYERAIEIDGNRPEAYFNLGLLYNDYMNGTVPELERAKTYYEQFVAKAGSNERFAETVTLVTRRCRDEEPQGRRRRRRRRSDCRPGRIQNIDRIIAAIREGEEMQAEADRMQREMEAQEAQQRQQEQEGGGGE